MGLTRKPIQVLATVILLVALFAQHAAGLQRNLYWNVENKIVTRNCATVNITTVNGQFPGPTVDMNEGDTVVIKVTNRGLYDITIHWHGIFQFLTNWADGPAHTTQCPLKFGQSYTYEFTVTGQSGTFWWHAHINWLRATVHGAFIVHPKISPYGLLVPEIPILLGSWYSQDPNIVEQGFLNTVQPVDTSTLATTINGKTGPLNGCPGTETIQLTWGITYLLRLINVGLNDNFYFKVAQHSMTVVAADGNYLRPFTTDTVVLTPGQTTDVLLKANKTIGKYYFGASVAAFPGLGKPPPTTPGLGIFQYLLSLPFGSPSMPSFPSITDLNPVDTYLSKLKNLNPYSLPQTLNKNLLYLVGVQLGDCNANENCTTKLVGAINNFTFDDPKTTSLLQAYYNNVAGVYTTDFPDQPPVIEDFTVPNTNYLLAARGTRVKSLNFGDIVQVVLQSLTSAGTSNHPFHLHGQDFYVMGRNYGNYDPNRDPANFNLVDPPLFNTITIPQGGWVAIRFKAINPGVWLLHCHYELHKSWGMQMAFITANGVGSNQTLPGPKYPLPSC